MIELKYDAKKDKTIISGDYFNEIREHFSVENKAAFFMRKYNRFIPRRNYAITPTGRCDVCLADDIRKFLIKKNYAGTIKIDDALLDAIVPARKWHKEPGFTRNHVPLKLELRDYQIDIVNRCLDRGRGTIVLATAGGKTLTIASLLSNVALWHKKSYKVLLIVPDRGLVEQTYSDFISYGIPLSVTKWTGDDEPNLKANIIIANLGILQSDKTDLTPLYDVDVLVVDEVHKLRKDNKVNNLIKLIRTPFKFGLTGTMPEDLLDQLNITGKIGPIIYEKSSFDLRVENYVSNVTIQILKLFYKNPPKREKTTPNPSEMYRKELDFIIENKFRNNLIAKISNGLTKNTLILIDYIKHGEILFDTIKSCNKKKVYFIRGEVEVEEREHVRKLMETENDIIIVAISKIFSTGINVKNLHHIIFAGGGKAKIKLVQSIGRGLRLHIDKDKLIIFDIADQLYYGIQHMQKRFTIYEKEKITSRTTEFTETC